MNVKGILILLVLWASGGVVVFGQASNNPIEMPQRGLCAHRGCMDTHPENTLPAFQEAIRLGAQMIEFDIQLSKDSMLVVMHDSDVDRTTNGKGKVEELTFAQIRALDAGAKKSARFKGTQVPTFEETLAMMPRNVWLNCHLKGGAAAGAKAAKVIAASGRLHQAFLTCSEEAADAAKALVPGLQICNVEGRYRKNTPLYAQESIRRGAEFLQLLRPEPSEDRAAPLQALRENGVKVNYFYAKTADELESLWGQGVDFILVNNLADFLPEAKRLGVQPVVPIFSDDQADDSKRVGQLSFKNKTLIVFFDGLRPDYITAELMPNLYAFKQQAAYGNQHHSIFPTVTRVNSTSYSTGSYPGTHGLMGNSVYFPKVDPARAQATTYSSLSRIDSSENGKLLTAISMGEVLQQAGERMMVFSSGSTGQAFLQNHKVGDGAIVNHELILPKAFEGQVLADVGAVPNAKVEAFGKHRWVTDALAHYGLRADGPLVSAIWYSDPDGAAHRYGIGSKEAIASIKYVDGQFGRLLDTLEARGMRPYFNILISADHGFLTHKGKQSLTDLLIAEGLKKGPLSEDVVVSEGAIYVKNHQKDKIKKIVATLHRTDWVGAVFTKASEQGDLKGWVQGTLSFDAIHYQHPTRTGDILVAPNWNDDPNENGYAGTDFTGGVAGHGGTSPYEVHIALLADGPDFKNSMSSDLPTSNVDLAPTVLGLYGLSIPESMDGRVMNEILVKTPAPVEKAQKHTIETKVQYPWGQYKLSMDISVLGGHRYVDFTKTERSKR